MKHFILSFSFILVYTFTLQAQVGINTASPNSSAALDVTSTDKGLLIPRVASTNDITAPTAGMMVYQTGGTSGFYFYDGQWALVKSDNLGNHMATTNLNMASQDIIAVDSIGTSKAKIGPNTYPTTTGTNGQVLTTDGAGALSWGSTSAGSGSSLQLVVSKTASQTIGLGSSLALPPLIVFESANGTGATLTGGNTWTADSLFTVGPGGAGTYLIQVSLIGNNPIVPQVCLNGNANGGDGFYGTSTLVNTAREPHKARGQLTTVAYLPVGNFFTIRGVNVSTTAASVLTSNGSTKLTVVKLN